MPEPKEDVKQPDPSPDAIVEGAPVVDEGSTPQSPAQDEGGQESVSSTPDVKPEVKDTRPIDNVAWEAKRKVDELLPKVDKIMESIENLSKAGQPQQPQYSKTQLLTFASNPDTPVQERMWAFGEVEKLEKSERQKELQEIVRSTQERTEVDTRRTQGVQMVAQMFPDMLVKDGAGHPVGWNQGHPVLMKANEYMARNRSLQQDPEGFVAAVKMAAFDLGVTPVSNQKVDRTVAQLRKEQKKQLASSGGTRVVENAEQLAKNKLAKLQVAYAAAQKNPNDSQEASRIFAEMVKLRNL